MTSLVHFSLFAAAFAGTFADDVLDHRLGTATLSLIAHLAGFFGVLHWAMPDIGYNLASLASLCLAAVLGVAVMLGARLTAYVCGTLLAIGATS